jgi:hypothetical protein
LFSAQALATENVNRSGLHRPENIAARSLTQGWITARGERISRQGFYPFLFFLPHPYMREMQEEPAKKIKIKRTGLKEMGGAM